MIMRFLFFLLLINTVLFAQEDYTFNSLYRTFEEGQTYAVLNNQSSIYAAPDANAAVVTALRINQPILIKKRLEARLKVNGFQTNWYHVSFNNGQGEGYIWGGNIAVGVFKSKAQSQVTFLYGIHHIGLIERGGYVDETIQLQLNVCKQGLLMHQLQFEAMGTLYTKTQGLALGNKGLASVKDVIEIAFSDGYCGGVSAQTTIFWDGRQLHYGRLLSNGYSNTHFSNQYLIFPNDEGGAVDRILFKEESGTFDANKQPIYDHQNSTPYIWTGQTLKVLN